MKILKPIEMNEQDVYNEVVFKIEDMTKGLDSAQKLSGDICVRVLSDLVNQHFQQSNLPYKTSDNSAYIVGLKTEFDLLIVKKCAKPIPQTNCYKPDDVCGVIEVKLRGLMGGDKNRKLDENIEGIKNVFKSACEMCKMDVHKCIYFTLSEKVIPKKLGSIKYFDRTVNGLNPFPAICIFDNGEKKTLSDQWVKFLQLLTQ